jgi:hypothetical protein
MATTKLPILRSVTMAYRDAWNAISAMPALAAAALVIILAISVLEYVLPLRALVLTSLGALLTFLLGIARNFLITPVMIAVHRFIVLDEVTPGYVMALSQRRFQLFFGWLLALTTVTALMSLAATAFAGLSFGIVFAFEFVVAIVMVIVMLKLAILFPAIAVDAPGATATNAWADSKGHAWRIFLIIFLASLPVLVVMTAFVPIFGIDPRAGRGLGAIAGLVVGGVANVFLFIVYVAIASRLFQSLADRLTRPA